MSHLKPKHYGSTDSLGSRGSSLSNLLKDSVDNLEDSVTKRWLSWMLRRHIQSSRGKLSTETANQLVDSTVERTVELVRDQALDPMPFEDEQMLFEEKFLFFRMSASITFHTGDVGGLTSLQRHGDATLELDGDWLTLQTALTCTDLQCRSVCAARVLDRGPSYVLTSDVETATLKLKARINTVTGQVIICTGELVHVGDMIIRESGEFLRVEPGTDRKDAEELPPPPMKTLLDLLSALFVQRCRDQLTQLLEHQLKLQLLTALLEADAASLVGGDVRKVFRGQAEPTPPPALPLPKVDSKA